MKRLLYFFFAQNISKTVNPLNPEEKSNLIMEAAILILGVFSSITLIISALSTGRKRMLIFSMTTSALCLIQYSLNNSTLALIIGCISLVRSLLALISLRYPKFNTWPFLVMFLSAHTAAFLFTADFNNFVFVNALPVVGAYLGTIAIFFKRMAITKGLMIACGMSWLVYEFSAGFYTQMIGETFTLFANAFALIMILKAEKAGMKDDSFEALDTAIIHAVTGSIPVIKAKEALTGSIPVIKQAFTNSIPIVNVPTNTLMLPVVTKIPAVTKIPQTSFPETGNLQKVSV